ncbi:MAG: DUF1883 domain-containing protein [Flavobacteriales bacterium]|jgi:hypothetical protein|nr:MAG: DUF1883 domain-containing protein [Flavobacteriales bacterium]
MKFLHKTFELKKKEIIEVHIDVAAKVKFMTGRDFKNYKMGKTHTYYGGLFEESPVRFVVPFESVWNVVVEKGTFRNPLEVNAQCGVLPPNSTVRSSVAVDAPEHVRLAEAADAGEPQALPEAEADM